MPGRPLTREVSPETEPVSTGLSFPGSVEYYDDEDECYQEWAAHPIPAEEGFSYPDFVLQAFVSERHQLRRENLGLENDVQVLREEIKKLLGVIEEL